MSFRAGVIYLNSGCRGTVSVKQLQRTGACGRLDPCECVLEEEAAALFQAYYILLFDSFFD